MRIKNIIIVVMSAVLMAAGCTEEYLEDRTTNDLPVQAEINYLMAHLEKDSAEDTKTALDYDSRTGIYRTLWSEEDSIAVSVDYNSEYQPYEIVGGVDSSTATFSGRGGGRSYCAFYPYSMVRDFNEGEFTVEIPDTQIYTEGTFANESFPMIAQSNSSTLNFTNLFAVLKLNLTGKYFVRSVKIEANDPFIHLSGKATASGRSLEMADDASNMVRLVDINRQLDTNKPLELFITIPAQTYTGGITITVYSKTGYSIKKNVSTLEFERSSFRNANVALTRIDVGCEPVKSLKGAGTEKSPYLIGTMADLVYLQDYFIYDAYYRITEDIDLSPVCGEDIGDWIPIQNSWYYTNTKGVIDGAGHRITGLYSSKTSNDAGYLFGGYGGTMKDLTIVANVSSDCASVFCRDASEAKFYNCIAEGFIHGGFSASAFGTAWNSTLVGCINRADMDAIGNSMASYIGGLCSSSSGSSIIDCINEGTCEFKGDRIIRYVGGIVGHAYGETIIANCVNSGDVIATGGSLAPAGITSVLESGSYIVNCYNSGSVASETKSAGLVGRNQGMVENCFNIGANVAKNTEFAAICNENYSICNHCFWLYEDNTGIGSKEGIITIQDGSSCLLSKALSVSAMQSEDFLGELNNWVDANSSEDIQQRHWKFFDTGMYPSLEYETEPHAHEDMISNIFELEQDYFLVPPEASTIQVNVISNKDFSVGELPYWICMESLSREADGIHSTISLNVSWNTGQDYKRIGYIKLTNTDGAILELTVCQHELGYYVSTDYSMDGKVRTIQNASVGNGIDLVVMGDAFSDRLIENGMYDRYMDMAVEAIFAEEPYKSFRDFFNVYAVYAVSRDEKYYYYGGGSTAFDCGFGEGTRVYGYDYGVLSYLQKAIGVERVYEATAVVVANDHRHSGTCYMYYDHNNDYGSGLGIAYCTINEKEEDFCNVVRHEAGGHGFAKLADEYSGNGHVTEREKISDIELYELNGWYKNIDFTNDPETVKWKRFINDPSYTAEGIGVFEGGATYDTGVYRPTENSIMRYNIGGFNAPSREAIFYRIHKLAYGDGWLYDRSEFLEYDRKNIPTEPIVTKASYSRKEAIPLAPPVARNMKDLLSIAH